MANQKIIAKKQEVVEEIKKTALDNNAFVLYEYQGLSVAEMTAEKDENGDFYFGPTSTPQEVQEANAKKAKQKICTTTTSGSPVEITVTVWLEGWQELNQRDFCFSYVFPQQFKTDFIYYRHII